MPTWAARQGIAGLGWLLLLAPALYGLWGAVTDALGPNPAQVLVRGSGDWALRFLWLCLAVTPLRVTLGWAAWAPWRRRLGLAAWGYASVHFVAYAWLDQGLDGAQMVQDWVQRPFIAAGMAAAVLLMVLAATSPKRMVAALGGLRWRRLHWAIYPAAVLALLHFHWMRDAKADRAEVYWMALTLAALLAWRIGRSWRLGRLGRTRSVQAL